MADRWEHTTGGYSFRFFSPEQVDQILRDGARRGRDGSHAAIDRILRVEPGIRRAELWQRLRELKFPPHTMHYCRAIWSAEEDQILSRGYAKGWSGKQEVVRELLKRHPDWRPHVIWKRAAKLHLLPRISKRGQGRSHSPWSEHDHQLLLNLAGYKAPRLIARMLHRSEAAVRYHLMLLGKSSRVHLEGFSRREVAADLHLGKKTVQRLIVEGLLQVRDPRITRESLDRLRERSRLTGATLYGLSASDCVTSEDEARVAAISHPSASPNLAVPPSKSSRAKRVWSEVASSLGVPLKTVENLIAKRTLKLYDPRITEESLRDLCRRYGSLINYEFLNRETREWLQSSMDLVRASGQSVSRRFVPLRKHARIVRRCRECGHTIRGNVFFRHIKRCGPKVSDKAEYEGAARDLT